MKKTPARADLRWTEWLAARDGLDAARIARADWPATLAQVRRHHLRATLHACLARAGCLPAVPDAVRREIEEAYRGARIEALAWQRALRLVLPALRKAGIEAVPYKGAALAFLVYDDPAERSMSDIDLWLADTDMQRACALLETLGFLRRENPDRPHALQRHYDGEIPLQGHALGIPLLELHWGVFPGEWLHVASEVDKQALTARLTQAHLFGTPVKLLAPHDHLLQIAAHAVVSHQLAQAAVRCLLDLVRLADRGVDWTAAVENARRWQLAGVAAHAFALAGDLFDRAEFREAAARLAGPARLRRLYQFADPEFVRTGRQLSVSAKLRYLMTLVDQPARRWRLLAGTLWPSRAWLAARYGELRLSTRIRHLAGALRGRF